MAFTRGFGIRRALSACALAFALGASGLACAGTPEEDEGLSEPDGDSLARESGFASDPDYVVRQRVLFEQETGALVRFERQPFSHRAKRWHVYPMTVYPGARVAFRLLSEDRAMAHVGEVRLYGPALSDGSFPRGKSVVLDEHGQAHIDPHTLEAGRYVVVVGPRDKDSFLARYPGNVATLAIGGKEPADYRLALENEGWKATREGTTYRVLGPDPSKMNTRDTATKLRLRDEGAGRDVEATVSAWSNDELFVSAQSEDDDRGVLGQLAGETFVLDPIKEAKRFLVVDAARVGKSDPFLLRVVPEKVGSNRLTLAREPNCKAEPCRVPVVVDDAAKECTPATAKQCGTGRDCYEGKCLERAAADLVEKSGESYKPLFIDPGERSTYSLEIACSENCMPTPVDHAHMTKYPVYFAHGFNSSKDTWLGILAHLANVPGFRDRSGAENVPAFEPTEARAERLRQRLATYIQYLEEAAPLPNGERMRVNIVAHSMGGLDSRTLIASPRYNEDCERATCSDIVDEKSGEKTRGNCCAPAVNGKPTMWRDRIASITTLSTPHRGSSFASWALSQMTDEASVTPALKLVADKFFGMNEAGFNGFRNTLDALSLERGEEREKSLPAPNPARTYTWACATKQESCSTPGGIEGPAKGPNGSYLLPPPNDRPTIFSWAAISCATGGCGNVLDPMLLLPYGVMTSAGEKKNDGVVGVDRARFGIFMGILPADHFDWTRTQSAQSSGKRALEWLFGLKTEPIERFHQTWLERLAASGY